jgi:hypothetical protein
MPDDAVARILGLVAEGRLTPEEASRLLDALDVSETAGPARKGGTTGAPPPSGPAKDPADRHASSLRIQVMDTGRPVVNLRVPLSLGRAALERVPGLSDATSDSIREAIEAGITGPILDVDEGGDGVRISLE